MHDKLSTQYEAVVLQLRGTEGVSCSKGTIIAISGSRSLIRQSSEYYYRPPIVSVQKLIDFTKRCGNYCSKLRSTAYPRIHSYIPLKNPEGGVV